MKNENVSLLSLRPKDTPEYMTGAWLGCIHWAIQEPEIVDAFRKDTGLNWRPARTPLERMIDEATGMDRKFIMEFIRWANVNVWGGLSEEYE